MIHQVVKWALRAVGVLLVCALVLVLCFRASSLVRESNLWNESIPVSGRFVQADDVQMFVQEAGPKEGIIVVLIGGTGSWSEIWRSTIDALADEGFRVIALDVPPFGFSQKPDSLDYSDASQGSRIAASLDELGVGQVVLVGHSFGSRATVEAAMLLGDRVDGLVLADAALGIGEKVSGGSSLVNAVLAIGPLRTALVSSTITNPLLTRWFFTFLIADPDDATPELVEVLHKQMTIKRESRDIGLWLQGFVKGGEMSRVSDPAAYEVLDMPALVVWGNNDTITPLEQGQELVRILPDAELVVLRDVGHMPHLEDAQGFNAELIRFLRRIKSDS